MAITIECASDKTEPYAFYDVVYNRLIELCTDICRRNGKKKLLWLGDKDKTLAYEPKSDEMILTVHRWFANKSCPGSWMYSRMGDLAAKVTKALGGTDAKSTTEPEKPSAEHPDKLTDGWYRVRKTWGDGKSQIGAYKYLKNAKQKADENAGYYVFDNDGKAFYPTAASTPKEEMPTVSVPFLVKVGISDLNIRKGPGTNCDRTGMFTGVGVFTIVEVKSGKGSTTGWGKLKSGAGWISLDYAAKV